LGEKLQKVMYLFIKKIEKYDITDYKDEKLINISIKIFIANLHTEVYDKNRV